MKHYNNDMEKGYKSKQKKPVYLRRHGILRFKWRQLRTTLERHVSTPQSSSARDDTIDLSEDVENVPPESSPVAELGRNPKPKRRPSNTVLEQLATAVNDAEKSKMDDFEIS
ncbi:hypothetical protein Q1695_012172 [Nippostrongylus brasiliensis]|nr:hypothetical protein Q1695_012172 [Nippostrongylus brasiliensis]